MGDSPARRVLLSLPAAALGAVVAGGCGDVPDVPVPSAVQELEAVFEEKRAELAVEADRFTRRDSRPELSAGTAHLGAGGLRFDPEAVACEPRPYGGAPGAWETSAPRERLSGSESEADGSVEVGLRNRDGATRFPVNARVITPDDTAYSVETTLTGTAWRRLSFPDDFPAPRGPLHEGSYTVVWSASEDLTLLACDGFHRG
ncbi:hypothetical protein HNR23_003295 [Nocardiopsis mwathae]|uniref:Lipoprotein n=1 Tax=Nocardiopsis mwathae TaxID=1472723 RepID=A0A7W9YJR5_9ACTN|nr:hypothetical protein [Nocardiopsis mwathae]MBB6173235.1 hypothetical protein [Nocardiopsis mwathae]